ncbi:MAG TPA: EAL domain-containing protein [Clostridia bacterium]|nr:EAL domain-containing protein [Clostridia bacterium]
MTKSGEPAVPSVTEQGVSPVELQLLFENMVIPFSYYRMVYDESGRAVDYVFLAVNRAFEEETGKTREEVIGKNALSIFPLTEQYWIECFGRVAKTGTPEHITEYSAALGKWYSLRAYSPMPGNAAVTVSDVTRYIWERDKLRETTEELRTQQQENYRLAHEEPITGLPNRTSLYESFAERSQIQGTRFSIAIFAPDNLSELLASYGSVLSDKIMRVIAQRVAALFIEPNGCFSMTGTDIVVLYMQPCNRDLMQTALERAQKAIRQPVEIDGASYYISASCGVACFPRNGMDHDELIMNANLALFQAKREGEPIVFFSDAISETLLRRIRIRNELPHALQQEEFELYFQPQVQAVTDRIVGFEALLRWHSQTLGEVSPVEFIDVAEESHLILSIGAWVLKNACRVLRELNSRCGTEFYMAVNVSSVQLRTEDFVDQVLAVLKETGISPCLLELEVTESVLINRELNAIEKLNALRQHGVRIALDDFGTGYSSLGLLKDLKVSTLKIDKLFIQDPNASVLTKMIARLGHTLGAEIVAEGVETEEQLKYVRRAGCDRVQGFYRGLPMPVATLERFIGLK